MLPATSSVIMIGTGLWMDIFKTDGLVNWAIATLVFVSFLISCSELTHFHRTIYQGGSFYSNRTSNILVARYIQE